MHHLANGLDHQVRLLDRHVVPALIRNHQTSAGNGVDPCLVSTGLRVDFRPQLCAELPDGAAGERHLARADGIDQDEWNPSFEGGCIMSRIDEHDPMNIVGIHLRKGSDIKTAKRGADQDVRRRRTAARRASCNSEAIWRPPLGDSPVSDNPTPARS